MHAANMRWWRHVRDLYPHLFKSRRVLEVGSYDMNGSVRPFFDSTCVYVGLDWRPGPGVDVVSLAHEMPYRDWFDVVISASMLEHDPYWRRSLDAMLAALVPEGALLLSWGSAENKEHELDVAPDGGFHALPAALVLDHLEDRGVYVERFAYEHDISDEGGYGECGLVAFLAPRYGNGTPQLSDLRLTDLALEIPV